MTDRLTIKALHDLIGVAPSTPGYGVSFGPVSTTKLFARLSNPSAPALTQADFERAANRLGVPVGHIKGSRKVEAPRGAFDAQGRPTLLYERHKFRNNTAPPGRFDVTNPALSGRPYGAGGYGPFSAQYTKLAAACALDPEAAFRACSWGAFQVLGENAIALGYASAWDMVASLVTGEAAHLETYVRFIETNHLVDELRACRPNNPASCRPFIKAYNGAGYGEFHYDVKFAEAIAE